MMPDDLKSFLDELEPDPNAVGTISSSRIKIISDTGEFELGPEDCEKLLKSPETIKDAFEIIGNNVAVELYAVELMDSAMAELERQCRSVDEI